MEVSRAMDYKARGGKLLRIRLKEEDERVRSVHISGDFFLVPEESLLQLEKMLEGTVLLESDVRERVDRFFLTSRAQTLGVSSEDFVHALLSAKEEVVPA